MNLGGCIPLAAACLALAAGCSDPPKFEGWMPRPVVHEGYRARVAWPGVGWGLIGPEIAPSVVPGAIVVAHNDRLTAWLTVEPAPGWTLADALDDIALQYGYVDRSVVLDRQITFDGKPARKLIFSSVAGGRARQVAVVGFLHQEHLYAMFVTGPPGTIEDGAPAVEAFFERFTLLDGEVTGPGDVTPVDPGSGVGWVAADGVFRSPARRLEIAPQRGWRLETGSSVSPLMLRHPGLGVEVELTSANVGDDDRAGWLAETAGQGKEWVTWPSPGDGFPLRVADGPPGRRGTARGAACDERCVAVELTFPSAWKDRVATALGEARLEWIPGNDRPRPHPFVLAADAAAYGETYTDFARDLRWRRPPGSWEFIVDAAARQLAPGSDVVLFDADSGMVASLSVEGAGIADPALHHKSAHRGWLRVDARKGPEVWDVGGIDVFVSRGDLPGSKLHQRYLLATAVQGVHGYNVRVVGPPEDFDARSEAVVRHLELAPGPLEADVTTDAGHTNHRFGFALTLPGGAGAYTPMHIGQASGGNGAVSDGGALVVWRDPDVATVAVLAFDDGLGAQVPEWQVERVRSGMPPQYRRFIPEDAKITDGTLAGRPARVATWERGELSVVARDDLIYGVAVFTTKSEPARVAELRAGFSLL